MRFVIPVVFYEITKVGCVYWSDTTSTQPCLTWWSYSPQWRSVL